VRRLWTRAFFTAFNDNLTQLFRLISLLPAFQLCIATLESSEIILQLAQMWCISPQGMDSAVDEPPIGDNPSASKRSEVENSQARRKALFLNRRAGHLLPAPVREEVYPLETISAKRGKNRQRNM